ncbi:NAD-dependent epimerase/dehydratase family protein [Diplocloster agilis]|uniref:NAD(P)-dependent oxidoreductase n=1 Tax=Diplocloster agilis TaxID=2850323 RepID=A0A949NHS4_9FIRM|nr:MULTISPECIES: NAD(P)-dependent oxidoreductase [Lachnospiraceae]MBU9736575.1 NAD(P)-dependent oxidoreductase [Diplocloster agilis]MCU6735179.1 NAD(P)-dependent oxidoreductase [Suonthocola fibrivorans]SCJ66478.1 dTDP-glucose 4%2C6-dehydratase 2 [uncultured Clostridium sp.]
MNSKKRILIFGATGDTGIYVTEYFNNFLDENEYEVIPIGRRKTDYFKRYNLSYYSVDIEKAEDFDKLPTGNVYAIVHLAALLPARMKGYEPEKYIFTNILGTLNVLEYCKKVNADRILFTKSVSDYYGYLTGNDFFEADMPVKYKYTGDHTIYAISKCTAVELIEHYHQSFGIKNFIFRLPNIYSYSPEKYYYVNGKRLPISYRYMIDRAIAGEPIELWGDPKKGRDVVYVKDFAQILYRALLTDVEGGIFNVGSGKLTNMVEQITGIISVFCDNKQSEIIYCPEKRDCINYLMDISKTKEVLGYEPKYNYINYLQDYKKEMESNRFEGFF